MLIVETERCNIDEYYCVTTFSLAYYVVVKCSYIDGARWIFDVGFFFLQFGFLICSCLYFDCYSQKLFFAGIRFTLSRYGKPVVEIGGYRYNKYYICTGPRSRWVCSKKTTLKCYAHVIFINDQFVNMVGHHNHMPSSK